MVVPRTPCDGRPPIRSRRHLRHRLLHRGRAGHAGTGRVCRHARCRTHRRPAVEAGSRPGEGGAHEFDVRGGAGRVGRTRGEQQGGQRSMGPPHRRWREYGFVPGRALRGGRLVLVLGVLPAGCTGSGVAVAVAAESLPVPSAGPVGAGMTGSDDAAAASIEVASVSALEPGAASASSASASASPPPLRRRLGRFSRSSRPYRRWLWITTVSSAVSPSMYSDGCRCVHGPSSEETGARRW